MVRNGMKNATVAIFREICALRDSLRSAPAYENKFITQIASYFQNIAIPVILKTAGRFY